MLKYKKLIIICLVNCIILVNILPSISSYLIKINDIDDVNVIASFNWNPKYPDPAEEIEFVSNSYVTNGYITSYKWNFGNGTIKNGQIVRHTFNDKGRYKVTLTVTASGIGGWDSSICIHYIDVGADPFPEFTFLPDNPSPNESVILNASKSYDPDGEIIYYNWSYYNINNPNKVINIGSTKIISYTWHNQGIYNVTLSIADDKGNVNKLVKTITVSILKIEEVKAEKRELKFNITNNGNITTENIKWTLEIIRTRVTLIKSFHYLYQKNDTIDNLNPNETENIMIDDIPRAFCKIKLVVTAESDNAVKVTKSFYGLVFGKYIYLSENNFINPYHILLAIGLGTLIIRYYLAHLD